MRSSRTFIYSAFILVLLMPASDLFAQSRPTFPIVYISVQKILTEAEDAKAAQKQLEALRVAKAQDLTARKQAIDATKLQIANAGGIFSSARREELKALERRQEAELQQATQQAQTDFTELQKKLQERLRNELNEIVKTLATQRGVMYVLNQDAALVLAPTAANWTADVLERLNAARRTAEEKAAAEKPSAKKP